MFKRLLNSDDDWIERLRRYYYPKLHPLLAQFGGYAVGRVNEAQYTCTVPAGSETLEEILVSLDFERNPIACYKSHKDGRESIGSWALRSHDAEGVELGKDKQLHVTLLPNADVREYVDVYCHREYDWQDAPLKHLQSKELEESAGSEAALELIKNETYLDWYDKENTNE